MPTRRLPAPSVDLITEAQHLWHRRRTEPEYSRDQFEQDLFALERRYGVDITPCASCGLRHGIVRPNNVWLCHVCWGDEVDRGWARYNDPQEGPGAEA